MHCGLYLSVHARSPSRWVGQVKASNSVPSSYPDGVARHDEDDEDDEDADKDKDEDEEEDGAV